MSCDVGKATEGLENELWHRWSDGKVAPTFVTSPTSHIILQPFRSFTNITAHSPTVPLLHLSHSSFSNSSFASPTSQALHLIHLASSPWLYNRCQGYLKGCSKIVCYCNACIETCGCHFEHLLWAVRYPHYRHGQCAYKSPHICSHGTRKR